MPLFGPSYPLYPHRHQSEIIKILEAVVNSYHDKEILLSLIIIMMVIISVSRTWGCCW